MSPAQINYSCNDGKMVLFTLYHSFYCKERAFSNPFIHSFISLLSLYGLTDSCFTQWVIIHYYNLMQKPTVVYKHFLSSTARGLSRCEPQNFELLMGY